MHKVQKYCWIEIQYVNAVVYSNLMDVLKEMHDRKIQCHMFYHLQVFPSITY